MSLTIVRYSVKWEVAVLEEGQYRETPKQFKFDKKLVPFLWQDHVDKDLEDVTANREGYAFSRTLSAKELMNGYADYQIGEFQRRVNWEMAALDGWEVRKQDIDNVEV